MASSKVLLYVGHAEGYNAELKIIFATLWIRGHSLWRVISVF